MSHTCRLTCPTVASSRHQPLWVTMVVCGHRAQTSLLSHQSRWAAGQALTGYSSRVAFTAKVPSVTQCAEGPALSVPGITVCWALDELVNIQVVGTVMVVLQQCESHKPYLSLLQIEAIMKGFASIEANGHAGELGSTGIRLGDAKFQVCETVQTSTASSSVAACKHGPAFARRWPYRMGALRSQLGACCRCT